MRDGVMPEQGTDGVSLEEQPQQEHDGLYEFMNCGTTEEDQPFPELSPRMLWFGMDDENIPMFSMINDVNAPR